MSFSKKKRYIFASENNGPMLELVNKTHLNCVVHCGRESSSLSWATKFVSVTIARKKKS